LQTANSIKGEKFFVVVDDGGDGGYTNETHPEKKLRVSLFVQDSKQLRFSYSNFICENI